MNRTDIDAVYATAITSILALGNPFVRGVSTSDDGLYMLVWSDGILLLSKVGSQSDRTQYTYDKAHDDLVESCLGILPDIYRLLETQAATKDADTTFDDVSAFFSAGPAPAPEPSEGGEFTEADVDLAYAQGLADGVLSVKDTEWQLLTQGGGSFAASSNTLGTITESGGIFSCDVVGDVPADITGMSWATIPFNAVGAGEFSLLINALSVPTGAVRFLAGFCSSADLATATVVAAYGIDSADGDPKVSIESVAAGVPLTSVRSGNGLAGAVGVRGSHDIDVSSPGKHRIGGLLARALHPTGVPESDNPYDADKPMSGYINDDPAYGIHLFVAFSVQSTVASPITTTGSVKTLVAYDVPSNGLATAATVWGVNTGQSNNHGKNTGPAPTAKVGSFYRQGVLLDEFSTTADHGPEVSMLSAHNGDIPRGIVSYSTGGTDIDYQIATIAPDIRAFCLSKGIVPTHVNFIHGEADSKTAELANAYGTKLVAYIDAWLAFNADIKFNIVYPQVTAPGYAYRDTVTAAMTSVAATRSSYVRTFPGPFELGNDDLHTSAKGVKDVGDALKAQLIADGAWNV